LSTKPDIERIDRLFRTKSAQAVASLARIFNDFDRAEDAVQDAYLTALERWPQSGMPSNPAGWILTTARNRAIDRLRHEQNATSKHELLAHLEALVPQDYEEPVLDDRLGLIFACCHPALNLDTRIALTLRFAAGFTVEEIAGTLLVAQTTIAQRLVRAKRKIRDARLPFAVPESTALPERLSDVLRVLYLIFNEGYASSTHANRVRAELCDEAQRLAELLEQLLPSEPEIAGLRALMLFHDARRDTRVDELGDAVLLEEQDRSRWDARKIIRGLTLLDAPLRHRYVGPYQLQAAIAAEHVRALAWEETNWFRIRAHYDALYALDPSPVVALNRSVAVAYTVGDEMGLQAIESVRESGVLDEYAPFFGAQGELLRRLGRSEEAASAFQRAIRVSQSEPERRFFAKRLALVASGLTDS